MEYTIDRIALEDDVFLIKDETKQDLLISGENIKTINGESLLGSGDINTNLVEITYSELRSLRDESLLVPGQYYRITDYVTTCAEHGNHYSAVNTYSAGHQFDIIVMALSEDKLDENASAVLHEGDTYFDNCAISQWKIDYTIDNDTEKFRWASPDGKGVIYYMEDEHGNACTYDFKNIQYDVPSMSILGTNWKHDTSLYDTYEMGFEEGKLYYTFSFLNDSGEIEDASMVYISNTSPYATNNVIKRPNDWGYLRDLPVIVILSLPLTHDVMTKYDYNYIGRNITTNKFDETCEFIFMIAPCERTCFKPVSRYNIIGPSSVQNYFGDYTVGNFIEAITGRNTIGSHFKDNILGSKFFNNTISGSFNGNTIGEFFQSNNIGENFGNNTIGDYFYYNNVGSTFYGNRLGNMFQANTFGTYFVSNILSLDSDMTSLMNNCIGCKFDDGVYTNIFYPKAPYDNTSDCIQNVHVCRGICGTSSSFNYVEIKHKNSESEITITKISDNNVVEHCVSDWCLGNKTKQSINLVNGFNWISFYVNTTLEELQSSLGDKGLFIRVSIDGSQDNYLQNTYDSQTGTWSGDITELDFTTSYIIRVSEDCTIEVSGNLLDPEEYIITLNPGWNYIGFPLDCEFDFINDLDILTPSDDDTINTFRDGFVVFNTTMFGGWLGQFTTLKPGMGYRYLNNSNETKYITFSKSYKSSNTILKVLKSKQDKLVDNENIKTINGESLLGEGNIKILPGDKVIQRVELLSGHNMFSAYVKITTEELMNALGDKCTDIIYSSEWSAYYDPEYGWDYDLHIFDYSKMYMIDTSEACTIELSGELLNPDEILITIEPGWNWIGYPSNKSLHINDAFINITPQEGDICQIYNSNETHSSEYRNGQWTGDLEMIVPSKGYQYYSTSSETKTFTFPTEYEVLDTKLSKKQDTLVSGTNIKTINGESLLGEGNITIRDFDFNVKSINRGGYSLEAPENTIPAYILSKKKGFTYVEGDVSFTSDNIAVLLRDTTIDRTSNGSGSISSYTYKKVAQYDFGSWKSEEYTETRIPTFKEWILCCRNLGLHPYIRLNSENGYTLSQINQIVNEVKECGMQGKVTYISFDNTHLGYIRNAEPYARLGVMTDSDDTLKISQAKYLKNELNEVFINAQLSSLTPTFLSTLIEESIPLEVWIVNTPDEIIGLPPYVSGITSDNLIAGKVLFEESSVYNYGLLLYIATQLLSLDKISLEFSNKDIKTLTAAIYPEDATEPVLWSTSDDSVAIVDNNGNVTPIDDGTCIITATSDGINAQCDVNVSFIRFNITKTVQGGTFENNSNSVIIGETYIDSIVANPGFTLNRAIVSITMGGIDITSSSYDNGKITIEDINGEVEINVQCTELSQTGDSFTLDVSRLDEEAILY